MNENFHRDHFLNKDEHQRINRLVQITAQYINLFISDDMDVLDVGGADGIMLDYIKGKAKSIDIFPADERVKFGTIYEEPKESYDMIIYNHVIEHIWKSYDEIEAAVQRLRPNGYIFIACPYFNAPWAYNLEPHVQLFNEHILRKMLKSLNVETLEYSRHCFREDKEEQWIIGIKKQ